MTIVSVRKEPEAAQTAIAFFQKHWASEESKMVYEDCILNCLHSDSPLPQWYLLRDGEELVGGAGMIPNDFISRMDLYPWLCALFIEKEHRGHSYGALLMEQIKTEAALLGFPYLYLCTGHVGYYERYGFEYLAQGYHPWGENSRIYRCGLNRQYTEKPSGFSAAIPAAHRSGTDG